MSSRLVMVSNRLPIVLNMTENGIDVEPGSGGLVTAIAPLLRDMRGSWIGWTGSCDIPTDDINAAMKHEEGRIGFSLTGIGLTAQEVEEYYLGFSNELLWPLFHDLPSLCIFDAAYWKSAHCVMSKFADVVIDKSLPDDLLWIHDYQLLLLASKLREREFHEKIAFFLHIPFPSIDIFMKLPWRLELLRAMLDYNSLGFQASRDLRNFVQCVQLLLPDCVHVGPGRSRMLKFQGREIRVGVFPISINYREFSSAAASSAVAERAWCFHEELPGQQIVFSLDRLDMTKGIPYRLKAIGRFLETHPEFYKKVTFIQVVVPSRTEVVGYKMIKAQIDGLVSDINSRFTIDTWVPIHYIFRSLTRDELLMYYRTSEVCLVTPIKDGMNLVSKEYVASNVDGNGVLILSEFAGAAFQLRPAALLVNPYDVEGVASAIHQALTMEEEERRSRMVRMRKKVKRYDVFYWMGGFLHAAFAHELRDFHS